MTDREELDGTGWTVLKVVGLVLASLGMVGFGFAGLCGIVAGSLTSEIVFVGLGLLALILTVGCALIVVKVLRSTARRSS